MKDIGARLMVTLILIGLTPILLGMFAVVLLGGTLHAIWTEDRKPQDIEP